MHEDVFRALAARQEAEALGAVEPLDQRTLEPARGGDLHMGAYRRQLRGMNRGRLIHRKDLESLVAALATLDEGNDARSLEDRLVTVAAQAGYVQENILHAIVRNDEAEAFGDVEPLDDTGDFNKIDRL